MKTRWEVRAGWYDHDLEFTGNRIIYKQWFDSGKDPNRYEAAAHEFLAGELHGEIRYAFGERVLNEVVETVARLTSGGPGIAEPPD